MKALILSACLTCFMAFAGLAGPVEDSIVRQLREQGFSQIDVRRTLLGRSRIVARSSDLYREIVVNPVTGEILRDFWRQRSGEGGGTSIVNPGNPGGSIWSGGGRDDDDDDDDDRDDDDRDDDDRDDGGDSDNGGDSDGGDNGDD